MAQINKPSDYFNTVLWSGNSSTQAITGVGFQPDFNWIKVRTDIDNHILTDSVRPSLATLNSDRTTQELGAKLSSLDSDGFTCTSDSTVNGTGQTYVGWNWLASNTTASNTDGSITSTVSANTTSGFSIVSYTGTGSNPSTVGHGLGVAPKMIIARIRNSADNWRVGHDSLGGWNYNLSLQSTEAKYINTNVWNSTAPSSTYFTIGAELNSGSGTYIAYCFAEKKGFSKFGSYTGNGSADGTFVYTGFKPAMVIIKQSSAINDWYIYDNKRDTYNVEGQYLYPNNNQAEGNFPVGDFLSNGFKIRTGNGAFNASGGTYIYMCFAENPLVGTNNIPTTAR